MQCDAPRGRERSQVEKLRLSKEADSDATKCAAMRCDRWFISVRAGVGRYPSPWQVPTWQVPGKAAGAGGWFAKLAMAHALLGRSAEGGWRGQKAKIREGHPMIAWETMDARKRGELLLPCVRAGAESLKAAIELGQAGSV